TGFKVQADVWVNPTERTLVYALGSYSTAFNTYYAVGRLGYDFLSNGVFFGPEVGGLGNDRTDQFRLGAHLSDIKVGSAKLTISGGWMRGRNEGGGAYSMATLDFSFSSATRPAPNWGLSTGLSPISEHWPGAACPHRASLCAEHDRRQSVARMERQRNAGTIEQFAPIVPGFRCAPSGLPSVTGLAF